MTREYKAGKFFYTDGIAGPDSVLVTRVSTLTGVANSMLLPLTREQFEDALGSWVTGVLIQEAFAALDRDQREFVMTGSTPEEWNKAFGKEEE
jgi:hypothetical protein